MNSLGGVTKLYILKKKEREREYQVVRRKERGLSTSETTYT